MIATPILIHLTVNQDYLLTVASIHFYTWVKKDWIVVSRKATTGYTDTRFLFSQFRDVTYVAGLSRVHGKELSWVEEWEDDKWR